MEEIRLQKFLAEAGIASRRKCEELIEQGRVKVNGKVAALGTKVNKTDKIELDGKPVQKPNEEMVYILLNKPMGYVTTVKDEFDRPTVMELVPQDKRIVPVGRLDMYTSGALILSNDGDFVYKVTHPSKKIDKTYLAKIKGSITDEKLQKLRDGVKIEDYVTSKAKVSLIEYDAEKDKSIVEVTIHEGRNRQVRKMFEAVGKEVLRLHRTKIGGLGVEDLKLGRYRYLSSKEVALILDKTE